MPHTPRRHKPNFHLQAFSLFPCTTTTTRKYAPCIFFSSFPLIPGTWQHKMQGADKAMESTPANEDSMTPEYNSNSYSPHDLVFHIDYHGVTTHPTPKHPKP